MVSLVKELLEGDGFKTTLGDKRAAGFSMVRLKNKFKEVDPTHFRNVLNNVRMTVERGGVTCSTFCEVQLQHAQILKYNDESHAHGTP